MFCKMMLVLTSLVFSGFLMTQAADPVIDDLNAPPLFDPVHIFDVTTDAPIADVKAALSGVKVHHSFKVIGERRYYLIIANDSSKVLRDLDFPAGSVVTQYPAEHISDFYRMFGVISGWEESYDTHALFDDVTVTVAYSELHLPDDVSADEYGDMMVKAGARFTKAHGIVKPVTYAVVGSYPPKFFSFTTLDDSALQMATKDSLSSFGGPGRVFNDVKHAVKV